MSTVSPSQSNAGDLITAAAINNPINQLAAVLNGGIDASNVTDGSITAIKLSGGNASMLSAWQSWTPSWTNFTPGNGTIVAKYAQIGKTVICKLSYAFNSVWNFPGGPVSFSLPVTATGDDVTFMVGSLYGQDTGVAGYQIMLHLASTTTIMMEVLNASGTYAQTTAVTSSVPFTWGTGDRFGGTFFYEAA